MIRTQDPPVRLVVITVSAVLLEAIINAIFSLGSAPFAVTVVVVYVVYIVYGAKTKDHTIWLWLLFGFVTGLVEVASNCDVYLVDEMKILVYPPDGMKIGVSPAYLPLAWGVVFTQLGLIGEWIRQRRSIIIASLLTAAVGGVLISIFENLARQAGWWYYQNTPMLLAAPYFVNLFEFLSTLLFVLAGWQIARSKVKHAYVWALFLGVAMGIWMCIAMRISFRLLGPCQGAVIQLPCVSHTPTFSPR